MGGLTVLNTLVVLSALVAIGYMIRDMSRRLAEVEQYQLDAPDHNRLMDMLEREEVAETERVVAEEMERMSRGHALASIRVQRAARDLTNVLQNMDLDVSRSRPLSRVQTLVAVRMFGKITRDYAIAIQETQRKAYEQGRIDALAEAAKNSAVDTRDAVDALDEAGDAGDSAGTPAGE